MRIHRMETIGVWVYGPRFTPVQNGEYDKDVYECTFSRRKIIIFLRSTDAANKNYFNAGRRRQETKIKINIIISAESERTRMHTDRRNKTQLAINGPQKFSNCMRARIKYHSLGSGPKVYTQIESTEWPLANDFVQRIKQK